MGIFNRNFNKPGPGVNKDEPRKKGFARFFELLIRDLGDLVKLNMILCVCVLPSIVMFFFSLSGIYPLFTFVLSLILAFPVGGAITSCVYYITKQMRDDPSYVWYEFKRKFKENYKQSAAIGILCTAFVYTQILVWITMIISEDVIGLSWIILALLSLLLFGMITPYIFLHFAYIDLKTLGILKNSVLMTFAYLPRSFMGAILGGLLWTMTALFFPDSLLMGFPIILIFGITMSMLMNLMWTWKPFDTSFNIEETLNQRKED
ncbi:MAG: DUF624 domain-containing protein [Oscillospiraceae bacterium]|nr:DUF624 domain-containing protein [Oscillospiraceae bacterium]